MKRIISFMLIVAFVCSVALVPTSALTGGRKYPQRTHEYLAGYNDTRKFSVTVEIYTGVKTMERWEYMWRNGHDLVRYENDQQYGYDVMYEYMDYRTEIENQKLEIMKDFFYNKFGAPEDSFLGYSGYLGAFGAYLTAPEIKRLEAYDEVLGVSISTPGPDAPFHAQPEKFSREIYNEEYLKNTTDELVDIDYYGIDELYALFRGGQKESDEKSELIIDDFLIIGSPYTHSEDNPTGLFVTTESGVLRTLREAYDLKVLHMDLLAMELPYVYAIGDADYDFSITIMDATAIQSLLAGIDEYKDVVCVTRPEDKDRDGFVTIMDATAVQSEIAGIDS